MDNNQRLNDEVDIVKIISVIWNGKFILLSYLLIFFLLASIYYYNLSPPQFKATTEVKPMSTVQFERFRSFNQLNFLKIYQTNEHFTKLSVVNIGNGQKTEYDVNKVIHDAMSHNHNNIFVDDLFFEQLKQGELFKDAFKKFNILDRKKFQNEDDFEKAIVANVAKIKFIPPSKMEMQANGVTKKQGKSYWTLEFEHNDVTNWFNVLNYVNTEANESLRRNLIEIFNMQIKRFQEFKKYEVEDSKIFISNLKLDMKSEKSKNIAYLEEQASIAREINVKDPISLIEDKTYPYYFNGYIAIEKEIKNLKSRNEESDYKKDMLAALKHLRYLQQDKFKSVDRAKKLFKELQVEDKDFLFMDINVYGTKFITKNKLLQTFFIALLSGFIFGIAHIVIRSFRLN